MKAFARDLIQAAILAALFASPFIIYFGLFMKP